MGFRAKSKDDQLMVWLRAILVVATAYVAASRLWFASAGWIFQDPYRRTVGLPALALLAVFFWMTRWDGVKREAKTRSRREGAASASARSVVRPHRTTSVPASAPPVRQRPVAPSQPTEMNGPGAEFYAQARNLSHQMIPDFDFDGDYLDLLGKSAEKGYPPALAKLGEYAARRSAWAEAYYWTWQARRHGMSGLTSALREIRKNWAMDGFPDECPETNRLFSMRLFSIGLALLNFDSGRDVASARTFLKSRGFLERPAL